VQTLLFYAQGEAARKQQMDTARWVQFRDNPDLRYALTVRDGYRCQCCGKTHDLRMDHVHPVSKGGKTVLDNLQFLCTDCDKAKGNQTIDYRQKPEKAK
jgi:5-methylcytosine-specific restriction endonuclease McrA